MLAQRSGQAIANAGVAKTGLPGDRMIKQGDGGERIT